MYKKFFGLQANPFSPHPDPRFLFLTPGIEEALDCLTYGINRREGFVLVTGEVGTGKTTIINTLLRWLRVHQMATAFVFNPRLDANQFLAFMMADFGIACEEQSKGQLLQRLNQWLLARCRAGQTAVLIIDEAQNLSTDVLEEIRLLTNLETGTGKLLQIVLVGQPELDHKLKQPQLRQLLHRITLRVKTLPLTTEETARYVAQRLHIAGANGRKIFQPEAISRIYEHSQGIPRLVNLICQHALVNAFASRQEIVSPEIVEQVAREFELPGAVSTFLQPDDSSNMDVQQAIRVLTSFADMLRSSEQPILAERKTFL